MPELTVILIIAGVSAVLFGGGIITAARVLTGRKTDKSED